jgi:tetratricopeptide (TPR) repeat protein
MTLGASFARSLLLIVLSLVLVAGSAGCVPAESPSSLTHLERARNRGESSRDPERVGAWMLAELVAPNGDIKAVAKARKRLSELGGRGVMSQLAVALDADVHGRFRTALPAYLAALEALLGSDRADNELLGWFVTNRAVALHQTGAVWEQARPLVERAIANPANLGWRGRGELVEWWSAEALHEADADGASTALASISKAHGCVTDARMAGPFGRGAIAEHRVHFDAERPGPWPARFAPDVRGGHVPTTLATTHHACLIRPAESVRPGVFYVQTFIQVDDPRDVILAVQGAYAIYVDDQLVLERDMARWGVWPRFGVRLRLTPGRHRVLARLVQPEASIRVLDRQGRPAKVTASAGQGAGYEVVPPELLPDPNALEPFLRKLGVAPSAGVPAPAQAPDMADPFVRFIASYLAHVEGQDDVASVIFEPLVKKQAAATPASLAQQAVFVDGDPIYASTVGRDLARDLREQAVEADAELWGARLWLALERGDKAQPADLARELEAVNQAFPEVPTVVAQLARVYGTLGWEPERLATLEKAAERFSEDLDVLQALLEAYEKNGQLDRADALAKRIRTLDPTREVTLSRALARRDYDAAIAELERIAKLRRDRKAIAVRIADLLVRAGERTETQRALELALENRPDDVGARLALADARFAAGDRNALSDALVDAIQHGSEDAPLRSAIELVEGATDLEPFRRDGLEAIADAEASGNELPGTAVRVLDYGALWVSRDGTARMLEHEIIRVQSREGIARHVEQNLPRGLILHMRTIKADGTILEPEIVVGKPTVTMPKLEVGDYIETEHILSLRGASRDGRRYRSPRWFFREENTSYRVSEFVIISPAGRDLVVETTGAVPEPQIDKQPGLDVHRWRVEGSVALPEEPLSAPINEFLPSVRAGWGIDLDGQLRRVVELSLDDTPSDPRMVRIAKTIVRGNLDGRKAPKLSVDEKARRIYRWVLDTVQPGKETAGPRIITGKSGDRMRAFTYLARLAGVDARIGLIRDRLAPPPKGPFSEAEMFHVPAVRLALSKSDDAASRWFVVGERFAPYGYLPSSLRGQPAVVIQPAGRITTVEPPLPARERTSDKGGETQIDHIGVVSLRPDGSASIELTQTYRGRYAIQLRAVLDKVPVSRRTDVVEGQLLGMSLPGGKLESLEIPNLEDLDKPVTLVMKVDVPNFARVSDGEVAIEVPFLGSLSKLVRLPRRQTPLYLSERIATRANVELRVNLPKGAKPVSLGPTVDMDEPGLRIHAEELMEGDSLVIRRRVAVPAGRVQPEQYEAFKAAVLSGDEALNRKVRVRIQ